MSPGWRMVAVELVGGPLDGTTDEVVAGQDALVREVEGRRVLYRTDDDTLLDERPRFHYVDESVGDTPKEG